MNNKGYIFDLLKLDNGWVITLLTYLRIGWLNEAENYGIYRCFQLGLGKLEFSFSLAWKNANNYVIDNIDGYT